MDIMLLMKIVNTKTNKLIITRVLCHTKDLSYGCNITFVLLMKYNFWHINNM